MAQVVSAPDGRRLAVKTLGDPAGRPVFLLHGTPGTLHGPLPRGIFLYRLGIRLISYTRPGYPESDRLPGRTVADAATDVEAIADQLHIDRFSVIGRSGGAPHALACAASKSLDGRLMCTAALSSLAPSDAHGEDFDWFEGMARSNIDAYRMVKEVDPEPICYRLSQRSASMQRKFETIRKACSMRSGLNCAARIGKSSEMWPSVASLPRLMLRRCESQSRDGSMTSWPLAARGALSCPI